MGKSYAGWMRKLTASWLTCLTVALWIAAITPRAAGYELSLAGAYPLIFWILTISASTTAALILLIVSAQKEVTRWWLSGFLGVIATNTFILSLPLFRGYAVHDRADALIHIGYARDIFNTGRLGPNDFYPAMHLLQVMLQALGGASGGDSLVVINLVFCGIWTGGLTVLVSSLARSRQAGYTAAAFSAPFWLLVYHGYALPSVLSAMLVPVLVSFHLQRSSAPGVTRYSFVVVELAVGFLIVFFHPVTTIYAALLFAAFYAASYLRALLSRHERRDSAGATAGSTQWDTGGLARLLAISLVAWALSFSVLSTNISSTVHWILGERERSSAIGEAIGLVTLSHLRHGTLVTVLFNVVGLPVALVALTSLLMVAHILRNAKNGIPIPDAQSAYILAYLVSTCFTLTLFFVSSSERNPVRLLRMTVILGLAWLAWWTWETYLSLSRRGWTHTGNELSLSSMLVVGVMLIGSIALGQLNAYPAPRNGLPNEQVTYSEVSGMGWLIASRTGDLVQASSMPDYTSRFEAALLGFQGRESSRPDWWVTDTWLPSHFYDASWTCIADVAHRDAYLILPSAALVAPLRFPKAVRQYSHQYEPADYARLAADGSANELYDNGGFQVWMTNKDAPSCHT